MRGGCSHCREITKGLMEVTFTESGGAVGPVKISGTLCLRYLVHVYYTTYGLGGL